MAPQNPSAFPEVETDLSNEHGTDYPRTYSYGGMSLRDYFAGQIIAGMFAAGSNQDDKAAIAYAWADRMLAHRSSTPGGTS